MENNGKQIRTSGSRKKSIEQLRKTKKSTWNLRQRLGHEALNQRWDALRPSIPPALLHPLLCRRRNGRGSRRRCSWDCKKASSLHLACLVLRLLPISSHYCHLLYGSSKFYLCSKRHVDSRPHDPEHELEWTIVAESVEDPELCRLRELHAQLEDCELHPTCRRRPLHRQAQTLLRFLRGRDGHVQRAEKMFRDMLDWRHSFDVEGKVHAWRRELERGRTVRARLCKAGSHGFTGFPTYFSIEMACFPVVFVCFCYTFSSFCILL